MLFCPESHASRHLHLAFEISLLLKALFAVVEIAGGATAFFVTQQFLVEAANAITHGELREDPRDPVANFLLHAAQHLPIGTQYFLAAYLSSHGVVKLWLIGGLLRKRLRYYPTAVVAFGLFVVYQLYRFGETHSLTLLVITAVDLVVIALTWHEYRFLRSGLYHPA